MLLCMPIDCVIYPVICLLYNPCNIMSLCVTFLLVLTAAAVGNLKWGATEKEASVPLPTEDVLAWTKREIGAFYSFNMITMVTNISNTQYFCLGVGGSGGWLPSPDTFNPDKLDMDNWLQAAVAFGAKYAVLTAQHCSGFSMWPSDIYQETGFNYTYSTKYSSFRGGSYDVVKDFINSCAKYGVEPGIYYSLNQNYYLNVGHGVVKKTSLVPGQAKVSQEMYGKIVLAQTRELWSNYGKLSEIWFDGGFSVPGITDEILSMLTDLQPQAVYFNGIAKQNNIRWVDTGYPIWSTTDNCATGLGDPNGNVFCPAETAKTLQEHDHWFWRPDFPIRNLSVLQQVYYHSVGQNTNLLLNTPANKSGLIEDSYFARYKEFGDWIQMCFGSSVVETSGTGYYLKLSLPSGKPFQFNKVVLSEDQSRGEAVLDFTISALLSNGTNATILTGQSVGNKFVRDVGSTLSAVQVVVNVIKAFYEPVFAAFSIHNC